jgi:hypothetical protein
MHKDEWNGWDERHRRQSCEGGSERVRATSEFQNDLRTRTKDFALGVIRIFSALPKTTEAQVLGKQLLRSGTSIGANYREAYRARSKLEWSEWGERHRRYSREGRGERVGRGANQFIAKCGDSLREIEEWSDWGERHRRQSRQGGGKRVWRRAHQTAYWLELLVEAEIVSPDELRPLREECQELTAIFVTILKHAKEP